jgi:4-hydroxyphenylpyruvate dioxygenase
MDKLDNPMGTDGFEFVEYAAPDPEALGALFRQMGFAAVAKHRHKDVTLYRQGGVNFIVNAEPGSFAQSFARIHGPCICAIAFRVKDAAAAYGRAVELGAWGVEAHPGPMELAIPAIKGIGDSLIYLVDRYPGNHGDLSIYDVDFEPIAAGDPSGAAGDPSGAPGDPSGAAGDPDSEGAETAPAGAGLTCIDHLTHNVHRGRMGEWAEFYERLFNFREVRYFNIEGRQTGLHSKAMTSPCGKIRIPINESADDKSQIQEYLHAYHGEGIQHVALASSDIYATVDALKARGTRFLDTPEAYYELLEARLPGHGEPLAELRARRILLDGQSAANLPGPRLLQIFTETVIGPIFFEIIQRKGDEGFGEGNFKALFESMELEQVRRGALKPVA